LKLFVGALKFVTAKHDTFEITTLQAIALHEKITGEIGAFRGYNFTVKLLVSGY
jgi:hypothetical protein